MAWMVAAQNAAVDGIKAIATHASIHNGDPSTSGANELTGGSPAYGRKAITWGSSSAGSVSNSASMTFDIPAATTALHVGLWTAITAGTFLGWFPYSGTIYTPQMATVATTGNLFTSFGHGFANGDSVWVYDVNGGSLAGMTEGTRYFVISSTTDTFQLSTTSGGASITVSANTELWVHKGIPEVFASQGTTAIAIGDLQLTALLL